MNLVRTIVVDDEALAREGVRLLLSRDAEVKVVGECSTGRQALQRLRAGGVDLAFLDVQMPAMSGFEVLAALPNDRLPVIVFVTAYDRFALQAFKAHAVEYLLKPFSDRRFYQALAHAKQMFRLRQYERFHRSLAQLVETVGGTGRGGARPAAAAKPGVTGPRPVDRLPVHTAGKIVIVKAGDIDWIGAADYCSQLHCGRETHTVRESMAALEARLDAGTFARIHRSIIVNIELVRSIEPGVGSERLIVLRDGTTLPVSRRYRKRIERLLGGP